MKNPPANAGDEGDAGSIPGSGRCPGGGRGPPLQNSCLENPTDRGAWRATVRGVPQGGARWKRLSTRACFLVGGRHRLQKRGPCVDRGRD